MLIIHCHCQQLGQRHRDVIETLEETHRIRLSGEGKIPTRMEEQDRLTASVYDACPTT